MQDLITYALALLLFIALYYLQKTKTIKDLDRLHEINEDIKKRFRDYKIQAYNLSVYLANHVDDRNEIILESIRVINVLLEHSRDNQEFINSVIVDELINNLTIAIKKSNKNDYPDYQATLKYLKSLRKQSDVIHDRIHHETNQIQRLLLKSNRHLKENVADLLFNKK